MWVWGGGGLRSIGPRIRWGGAWGNPYWPRPDAVFGAGGKWWGGGWGRLKGCDGGGDEALGGGYWPDITTIPTPSEINVTFGSKLAADTVEDVPFSPKKKL